MNKNLIVVVLILFTITVMSVTYMEFNKVKGEVHILAPHEYTHEITEKIDKKDIFYVPLWVSVLFIAVLNIYLPFRTLLNIHILREWYRAVFVLVLHAVALFATFYLFNVIGDAQRMTGMTAEFVVSAYDILKPFFMIFIINLIIEYYKKRVINNQFKNAKKTEEINILSSIIKERKKESDV